MRNINKIVLSGLIAISSTTSAAFAADEVNSNENLQPKTFNFDEFTESENNSTDELNEMSNYLVGGVIRDVAQKILPLSIEGRFYAPHLNAHVKSDNIYYKGGSVTLKDDLGFDNDNAPELIFRYKRFTMDYIYVHGSGDRNFSGRDVLTFGGQRYHGNVSSKSDLHYLKLNVTNPIVSVLGSGIDWSYGINGMYWKGKVNGINTSGQSASKSKSFGVPIPTLGIGARAAIAPHLNLYANISGLPLGGYGHFYDFEAGIRYYPLEVVGIDVGFRRIDTKFEHNDDSYKVTMNGPFAGIRVDF